MRGFGWSFKQVLRSMQGSFGLGLGLLQILTVGTLASDASEKVAGVYMYGESSAANQLGRQYVIFAQLGQQMAGQQMVGQQMVGQQIVGALYSPQSEYSCFIGQHTKSKLTVNVFDLATPVQPQSAFQVQLPTLKAIAKIGPLERQVLAACQREASMFNQHQQKLAQPDKPIERSKISMESFPQI